MPSGNDLLNSHLMLYALPSLLALTTKLLIFWLARHSLKDSSPWLWGLMLSLFGLNLMELIGFFYYDRPDDGLIAMMLFYCFAIASVASMLGLAMEISQLMGKAMRNFILTIAVLCVVVLLMPGGAIEGIKSTGYSVTRVAGPYYWVIQLYIVVSLVLAVALLFITRLKDKTIQGRKAFVILVAYSPIVAVVFAVMSMMHMGMNINASIAISLAVNVFLAVLLYTEKEERLFLFLSFIPYTQENRMVKKVIQLFMDPAKYGLEEARAIFEQEITRQALSLAGGNQNKAAELLRISRQTVSRKLNRKR